MSSDTPSIQWVLVQCPRCGAVGRAGWQDVDVPSAPRKLVSLSEGFCSIDRGDGAETDIRCMRCNDTHTACGEAHSGPPTPSAKGCAA